MSKIQRYVLFADGAFCNQNTGQEIVKNEMASIYFCSDAGPVIAALEAERDQLREELAEIRRQAGDATEYVLAQINQDQAERIKELEKQIAANNAFLDSLYEPYDNCVWGETEGDEHKGEA